MANTLPPFADTSTGLTPAAVNAAVVVTFADPCTVTILGPGALKFSGFGAILANLEDSTAPLALVTVIGR